jgi:acylphosphatase
MNEARRLGLAATARNLRSGAVELHVEGDVDMVEAFATWARKGPPLARVDHCELSDGAWQGLVGTTILR